VLQAGEFKLRPGIDVVPYDQLKELRLEDGLDVSRKVGGADWGGGRMGGAARREGSPCASSPAGGGGEEGGPQGGTTMRVQPRRGGGGGRPAGRDHHACPARPGQHSQGILPVGPRRRPHPLPRLTPLAPAPQEEYLSDAEFETVFGMDKETFLAMPAWKRITAKKGKGLF
jgi:hypothetical protein